MLKTGQPSSIVIDYNGEVSFFRVYLKDILINRTLKLKHSISWRILIKTIKIKPD